MTGEINDDFVCHPKSFAAGVHEVHIHEDKLQGLDIVDLKLFREGPSNVTT